MLLGMGGVRVMMKGLVVGFGLKDGLLSRWMDEIYMGSRGSKVSGKKAVEK